MTKPWVVEIWRVERLKSSFTFFQIHVILLAKYYKLFQFDDDANTN